ncbi:hypothetical protein [Streptomyces mobaraensis]|uniref:DivIVA domain-containing protein n=1 Tax=Streptomyces mobaraensis (strain ATCC 29032 / DSM 40847 / JCM 4168 / NBRC 13819 / NCIMB 11159 / IPCR 16-22) TaxID=1223523 RepID=M3AWT7_STRM1|nr:hypothetical protein [Streptomyces mobaraensis]EME98062.1 hypothetical protein H340_23438 [Streptomyces mobaraensis NBRC 13819 = DSM 40847]
MFWFLLIALVVVVAAVTLAVLSGHDGVLPEAEPDRTAWALPPDRPLARADVDGLRLPVAVRGYRMTDTDDVLDRLAAELAERDARIAELEAALAGTRAEARGAVRDRPVADKTVVADKAVTDGPVADAPVTDGAEGRTTAGNDEGERP